MTRRGDLHSKALSLALLLAVWASASLGQEAHFFSLEGEGTASMILDPLARAAYITDGGGPGQAGLSGVSVSGQSILDFLAAQRIEQLVITCTHPHRDHLGGLVELIRDPRIRTFQGLHIVDTPESHGQGKKLSEIYESHWGEPCPEKDTNSERCQHVSATNRNAFESLRFARATVDVDNFAVDPERAAKDAHSRSLILRYGIGAGASGLTVVDFDDASSRLILDWASAHAGAKADVLVAPHHGSRHNDISPLLADAGLEIGQVVITVNRFNRYDHPAPEVLASLIERFSADNVFITDSVPGRSVRLTPEGVAYVDGTPPSRALALFIDARLDHLRSRREEIERELLARQDLDPATKSIVSTGGLLGRAQLEQAAARGWLSRKQRRSLQSAYAATSQLGALREGLGPTSVSEHIAGLKELPDDESAPSHSHAAHDLARADSLALGKATWAEQVPEVWRAALDAGELRAMAVLARPIAAPPACAGDSACALAEGWPLESPETATWILFAPGDAGAAEQLAQTLSARGLTLLAVGRGEDHADVQDTALASTLIADANDVWVVASEPLRKATREGCPWACAANLLPRGSSPALRRYQVRLERRP